MRSLLPIVGILFLPAAALAAPASEEIDALSLLSGARQLIEGSGAPTNDSTALNDGLATKDSQYEPEKRKDESKALVIELAEKFDLNRVEAVNSFSERDYPGISTKKLRLEQGSTRSGPWTPLVDVALQKGTARQKFDFKPATGVRYVRVTFLENYGNAEYWSLADLAVYGRRTAPRAKIDFTGQWETDFGPMKLVQQGGRISGCYSDGSFLIEGVAEGPIFFGTYTENQVTGAMALALTAEGDLAGVYGTDITGKDRNTRWDGRKVAGTGPACGARNTIQETLEKNGRVALRGILFDTGKDVIKSESVPVLQLLASAIKEGAAAGYLIEGHTDDRGGEASNQTLSEKRAASVKAWLVSHGVDAAKLKPVGYGQTRPAMDNVSEAGRAANRRVEVAIK